MKAKPRVLLLSATSGAGHVRAAQALEKAFLACGDCVVEHIDALQYVSRLRSEEHTSELQSRFDLVCRLLLEKKSSVYYAQINSHLRLGTLQQLKCHNLSYY